MKCPKCGAEVLRVRIAYPNGERLEGCTKCTNFDLTPIYDWRNIDDTMGYSISVAHREDIRSRVVQEDGTVVRQRGKKIYIT